MTNPKDFLNHLPDTDECVTWPFYVMPNGYGQVRVGKHMRLVHTVVCEWTHGPCPSGKQVAHSCGRRACVNPRHLSWKTSVENNADKLAHGTLMRGEKHWNAKLSEFDVQQIRQRYATGKWTQKELASSFGVARTMISRIVSGKRWSHH